jgi:hypothetical protein
MKDPDGGPLGFTLDMEAYEAFLAKPMKAWRWRDLHELYGLTQPDPRRKRPRRRRDRATIDLFRDR